MPGNLESLLPAPDILKISKTSRHNPLGQVLRLPEYLEWPGGSHNSRRLHPLKREDKSKKKK